jgi:trk system potassium uptake protein TrkH
MSTRRLQRGLPVVVGTAPPLFVLLMGIAAVAMMPPAILAFVERDMRPARAFLYAGVLLLVVTLMIGIATRERTPRRPARAHLLTLVGAFAALPLLLAIPMNEAVADTRYFNAWFEMVSSFTTTGATLYEGPRLPRSVHLWRATVGWLGGFLVWLMAAAVLAPLNLGGFEVRTGETGGRVQAARTDPMTDTSARLVRHLVLLGPIYVGLTLALWVLLVMAGDGPFVALCHAMGTLSTSGISPVGGLTGASSGLVGEALVLLFLIFALSRQTFAPDRTGSPLQALGRDPEARLATGIIAAVTVALFLRHFIGAVEVAQGEDTARAAGAAWGSLFMAVSFLTTSGYESTAWNEARAWSGLGEPGTILVGLAMMGGGVATTAGGVKLLRIHALLRHGQREMERMVHVNSVGGGGAEERRIRTRGAYLAFVFFMLFAVSIAVVTCLLGLSGLPFEPALVLGIAALTNTGPLANVGSDAPILWSSLGDAGKAIAAVAMVLGRLEAIALLALFNPDFWRR